MTINMKDFIGINDIPNSWIYKYFCKQHKREINQPFDGRTIKIKSFWTDEKTPSLCIYFDSKTETYKWKDFSSGRSGNAVELVKELEGKTYATAANHIMNRYREFTYAGHDIQEDTIDTYMANIVEVNVKEKDYDRSDLDFFGQWGIMIRGLNKYNVKPIYEVSVKRGYTVQKFENIFGFSFRKKDGTLYQVYQPNNKAVKYLCVNMDDYMIGQDQLEFKHKTCGIVSGLKDLLAIEGLEIESEYVAPKSENSILSAKQIEFLKSKYKSIYTMFDNDAAGIKAMKLYKSLYGIPFIKTGLAKDIAEDRKAYDARELTRTYIQLINQKINT